VCRADDEDAFIFRDGVLMSVAVEPLKNHLL
jgi:hypothetical protein